MTPNLLDEAFLRAASGRQAAGEVAPPARGSLESAAAATVSEPRPPAGSRGGAVPSASAGQAADEPDGPLGDLLERFPEQWSAVVTVVEAAARSGHRTIAVAGHRPAEGRTTLVRGLALLLTRRDWQVSVYATATAWWQELVGDAATWQWREPRAVADPRDLVLVDAGIWFPPGPLRRQQLLLTMFGYDAVLLVRQGNQPASPGRDRLIEQAGLAPLGEVVSFASACSLSRAA